MCLADPVSDVSKLRQVILFKQNVWWIGIPQHACRPVWARYVLILCYIIQTSFV